MGAGYIGLLGLGLSGHVGTRRLTGWLQCEGVQCPHSDTVPITQFEFS